MTNEQLIAIEMKPLEGCAAVLVSFNRPFTHVEMNAMHHALNEHLIPHAPEPCEQRNEVNSIDDVAAICHSVTGLCCHILGSPGGPCTIGNCAAVRGYLGGPEFAQGASRDASSKTCPCVQYCADSEQETRHPGCKHFPRHPAYDPR